MKSLFTALTMLLVWPLQGQVQDLEIERISNQLCSVFNEIDESALDIVHFKDPITTLIKSSEFRIPEELDSIIFDRFDSDLKRLLKKNKFIGKIIVSDFYNNCPKVRSWHINGVLGKHQSFNELKNTNEWSGLVYLIDSVLVPKFTNDSLKMSYQIIRENIKSQVFQELFNQLDDKLVKNIEKYIRWHLESSYSSIFKRFQLEDNTLAEVGEWIKLQNIDVSKYTEMYCNYAVNNNISIEALMNPYDTNIDGFFSKEIARLLVKYNSLFTPALLNTGFRNHLIIETLKNCPQLMNNVKNQLIISIHEMYNLSEEQSQLVDSVGLEACSCDSKNEECISNIIKRSESKIISLFPSKSNNSGMEQFTGIIKFWLAVGCS